MTLHALLERADLRQSHDIEPTGDGAWPWQARSDDPQWRFGPLPQRGIRVLVCLEAETGTPDPVLYLKTRHGFVAEQAIPLQACGPGLWQAEGIAESAGAVWRLDPMSRPGRFRLTRLEVETFAVLLSQRVPALQYTVRQVHRLWRQVRQRWGTADWLASHEVLSTGHTPEGPTYQATGPDPQLRLPDRLQPGWYMLEAHLTLPTARAMACCYLDGHSEAQALTLPLRSGVMNKRLLWLPEPTRLRFDPMPRSGPFTLHHLQLVRVSPRFAATRMRRKLHVHHPAYRTAPPAGSPASPAGTQNLAPDMVQDITRLWDDYNQLFAHSSPGLLAYGDWIREVEPLRIPSVAEQQRRMAQWAWRPKLSVVMPTYNSHAAHLEACLDSVQAQTYPDWELCIADDASTHPHVRQILQARAAADARIQVAWRPVNGHICAASNTALALASGEFIVLLDHDDQLAPHALFAIVQALQQRPSAQLLYSDEDKLDEHGQRCDPFFKPDWSPDLLYSQNYVSHLGVYRRSVVEAVGGFREGYEGSQDHDLVLRCAAQVADARDIVHVPDVLYHWRMAEGSTARGHDSKDYASAAGQRALQDHFDHHHPGVQVSTVAPGIYRARWPLPHPAPRVSLIVPTRDQWALLRTCIESIVERTTYPAYEIVVVDNQSSCTHTLAYLDALDRGTIGAGRVRVLRWDHPFNYSALNNFAAEHASGEILGLVNNDIEVIDPDWLSELVSHAVRPQVGCVGAKLYYPDDTIQHAGVVLGVGGVANHALRGQPRTSAGYFGRLWTVYNPSAVTGAVLLIRRAVFEAIGGLDAQGLSVAFNDVDLCLKALQAGYRNVWTPHAQLYHHESVSRGADTTPEKRARFLGEVAVMQARWAAWLANDPAYHPCLTRLREDYALAGPDEPVPHRTEHRAEQELC